MDSKLWKIAGAAVLAGSVMTTGPAMAQSGTSESTTSSQSGNASAGQSTPSQFEQRDNSDKDWGWIGLLGLLGLAGLRRRRDPDLDRNTTSAKSGSGVYNR